MATANALLLEFIAYIIKKRCRKCKERFRGRSVTELQRWESEDMTAVRVEIQCRCCGHTRRALINGKVAVPAC